MATNGNLVPCSGELEEGETTDGLPVTHLRPLTLPQQVQDEASGREELEDLSPDTQHVVRILLKQLKQGKVEIDMDEKGDPVLQYKQAKKIWWDGSNANIIAAPKTDDDVRLKVDACLELATFLKTEKPPSGVVLDPTKVSLVGRQYKEGVGFKNTKEVLGSGNSAGDIFIVRDIKTGQQHGMKTVMLSVFRPDEIKCWVDMTDTGYAPQLYLFRIEGNRITIHMEILQDAVTLRSVIDDYVNDLYKFAPSLVKPFSLFVLDGALSAVSELHRRGWTHRDLHGGNVMLQCESPDSLLVKILDFGLAGRLDGPAGLDYRGFQADIAEVVRLFSALYTGEEFENVWDVKKNWKEKLSMVCPEMSRSDREELFCLVDGAMAILCPADVQSYRSKVQDRLRKAMGDQKSQQEIMKKVVALLFSSKDFISLQRDRHDSNKVECDGDEADSAVGLQPWPDTDLQAKCNLVTDEILEQMRQTISI